MKKFSLSILATLSFLLCAAQAKKKAPKFEVLLIGTSHQASATITQDTSGIMKAMRNFKPDAVAVEVIPAWDTVSLRNYRLKYLKQSDSIKTVNGRSERFIKQRITQLSKQLKQFPAESKLYDSLAFYYCLDGDIYGNSGYNWFISRKLSEDEGQWRSAFAETNHYKWSESFFAGSEFRALTFPFALQQKIKYLYPIDDQTDAPLFKELQQEVTMSLMKGVSQKNAKSIEAQKILMQQQAEYGLAEKDGKAYDFVNTERFQQLLAELLNNIYPKYDTSGKGKLLQETWDNRNKRICERIISIHKNNPGIKRIIVLIGAAHIPSLKKYLFSAGKITVKTLPDLAK